MKTLTLEDRVAHERLHAKVILDTREESWGWSTPAGRIRRQRRADFLRAPLLDGGAHVAALEIGCGTGTFTGDLAEVCAGLTSIDVSDTLLEVARERFPRVTFRNEDVHRTRFADETFDVVLGCSVLHHLDWTIAFREIHRILKPGGRLRFVEPNLHNPQIFLQKKWGWLKKRMGDSPDESAFSAAEARAILERTGFVSIDVAAFEFLHPSTPREWIARVIALESLIERTPARRIGGSIKLSAVRG